MSLAAARAAAAEEGQPLWRYLGGEAARVLPVPMMNVINGGAHADNSVDFQEFMVVPVGASSFRDCLRMGTETFHHLKKHLHDRGLGGGVGDEGGFAPEPRVQRGGARGADRGDRGGGLQARRGSRASRSTRRSSEIFSDGSYVLEHEGRTLSSDEMAAYWAEMAGRYPILSIEDGMDEEDWDGWKTLTDRIGDRVQLVGDDLFVTNTERLSRGIERGVANSILVKVNQIGTLTRRWRRSTWRARPATRRSCRTGRARRRTRRSPTSRWPRAAGRSRPAPPRARTAWRSTTSCCGSRRRWASAAEFPGRSVFRS